MQCASWWIQCTSADVDDTLGIKRTSCVSGPAYTLAIRTKLTEVSRTSNDGEAISRLDLRAVSAPIRHKFMEIPILRRGDEFCTPLYRKNKPVSIVKSIGSGRKAFDGDDAILVGLVFIPSEAAGGATGGE